MSKNTLLSPVAEEVSTHDSFRPSITRGLLREQAKRRRLRARVGSPLIVGVDLAREHQALTFHAGEIVGRARISCAPGKICGNVLGEAERLVEKHGRERVLFAMEPAGHYWGLAAESLEEQGIDYVLVHPLAVKREREATRYTPEKRDPRDADLISELAAAGKILEARLFATRAEARLNALAREYMLVRRQSAAEKTRLVNFWDRLLPELGEVLRDVSAKTALAMGLALCEFSTLSKLSLPEWICRVREHAAGTRIQMRMVTAVFTQIQAADREPSRRMTDALPIRIVQAAERRRLLQEQKLSLKSQILSVYEEREEAIYLDSITGSMRLYNALVLGLVGNFHLYDHPRAIVKLAGSEVNEYGSGDSRGKSRISHRGRNLLRAAAYQQGQELIKHNPDYAERFFHLMQRTEHRRLLPQQARVAVANSYLRSAHTIVTKRTPYLPLAERFGQEVRL